MSDTEEAGLVQGRSCEGCALCCMIFEVPNLSKPAGTWCPHCVAERSCGIYETRPQVCRPFHCFYKRDGNIAEHWKPSLSHMVIVKDRPTRTVVHVDPSHPLAWFAEPYYSDLKYWSVHQLMRGGQIHLKIGTRTVVVLPDRDVDLGEIGERIILTAPVETPMGPTLAFELVDRSDPRVNHEQLASETARS